MGYDVIQYMNKYVVAALLAFITTLLLAIYVFSNNKQSRTNRLFFFYSLSISEWALCVTLQVLVNSDSISLLWARSMNIGVLLIPVLFLHFSSEILNIRTKFKKLLLWGYLTAGLLLLLNFTTPFIIPSVSSRLGFKHLMTPGLLYPLVIIFFLIYSAFGLFLLLKGYLQAPPGKATQLKYLFWGSLFGYIFGASNFFPVYDITILPYPYGSYAIVIYVILTSYAIVRHKLMDINIIYKKT